MKKTEDNPDLRVLKIATCKALSGKSTLTYQIGVAPESFLDQVNKLSSASSAVKTRKTTKKTVRKTTTKKTAVKKRTSIRRKKATT